MIVCSTCGHRDVEGTLKCPECGARFESPVPPEVEAEVLPLIKGGRKIEAIKLFRERTGLGLREAKTAVERLEAREGIEKKSGCFGVLALGLLALAGLVSLRVL